MKLLFPLILLLVLVLFAGVALHAWRLMKRTDRMLEKLDKQRLRAYEDDDDDGCRGNKQRRNKRSG